MENDRPLVSLILLSYNRPDYLKEALDSVSGQSYENLELIVIDNLSGSSDQIENIVRAYPRVRLIRNSTNLGFAAGMNRGIEAATGDYVYLTEDDILLDRDCMASLVDYMQFNPSTGLATGIMYNQHSRTIRCAGGEFLLGPVYRHRFFGEKQRDTGQFSQPFEVTFVSGGAVFGRLELLRQLGGFREEFFMYFEDNELCARVLKQGYKIVVVPQAKLYHFDPPPGPAPREIEFHKIKNFLSLYFLHARFSVLPLFIFRYGFLNLFRSALVDRERFLLFLKAWWWVLRRVPSLLRERESRSIS